MDAEWELEPTYTILVHHVGFPVGLTTAGFGANCARARERERERERGREMCDMHWDALCLSDTCLAEAVCSI